MLYAVSGLPLSHGSQAGPWPTPMVGHPHNLCATFTPAHPIGKTENKSKVMCLGWCPSSSSGSLLWSLLGLCWPFPVTWQDESRQYPVPLRDKLHPLPISLEASSCLGPSFLPAVLKKQLSPLSVSLSVCLYLSLPSHYPPNTLFLNKTPNSPSSLSMAYSVSPIHTGTCQGHMHCILQPQETACPGYISTIARSLS